MRSRPIGAGQNILASQNNDKRDDARGGSFLLAHQQLGVLALGTVPTNGQVVPIVINGTTITVTAVTSIGSTPNNVLIGGSAAAFVQNLVNFLRRPDITSSTQVAASGANQTLLSYVGWAWPGSSTNIVPFSLNKNVNGITGALTSFNITGITVTSGTWTAQMMQLYIEDGAFYLAGTRYLFTGGSTPTVTAPASHPRIDVLTIDTSGTLAWTTGSENVSPVAPTYPANKIPICELYNVVGETALYDYENQQGGQGYIYNDVRPTLTNPYGLFILDPGSEAQGDVLYYTGAAWARLPAGTAGQVLKSGGPGANPSWATETVSTFMTGSGSGAYTTSSNSLADVDGTNLKKTVSGLSAGMTKLLIRIWINYSNSSNTGTAQCVLNDLTNSATVATIANGNGPVSAENGYIETFYIAPSNSIQFSLQWQCGTNGTSSIANSSSSAGGVNFSIFNATPASSGNGAVVVWIQTIQ